MLDRNDLEDVEKLKNCVDGALELLVEAIKIIHVLEGEIPRRPKPPLFMKDRDRYPKHLRIWEGNHTLDEFKGDE